MRSPSMILQPIQILILFPTPQNPTPIRPMRNLHLHMRRNTIKIPSSSLLSPRNSHMRRRKPIRINQRARRPHIRTTPLGSIRINIHLAYPFIQMILQPVGVFVHFAAPGFGTAVDFLAGDFVAFGADGVGGGCSAPPAFADETEG